MDIALPDGRQLAFAAPALLDRVGAPSDILLMSAIRHYFTGLRQQKGHQPDASPMDLEILLIIKFVQASCDLPVDVLCRMGIIIVAHLGGFYIAINNTLLVDTLVSSRSRINNTLKRRQWEMVPIPNTTKYELLKPLLDRSDAKNWTVRVVPVGTTLFSFAQVTPEIQFQIENSAIFDLSPAMQIPITEMVD
jgi:hypothetical protein